MKTLNARTKWAALLLASTVLIGAVIAPLATAQQTRNYWPGAGPTARTFGTFKDFTLDGDYNSTDFTTTLVEVGAGEGDPTINDALYGTLSITPDENPADATQIQSTNYCFKPTAGKHIVFATRFTTSAGDILDEDLLLGLSASDTTAVAGHANGITLEKFATSAVMKLTFVASGGGTTSDYTQYTLNTLVASTAYEYLIDIQPLSSDVTKAYAKVWCNGALVFNRMVTVDVPQVVMSTIAGCRNTTDTHTASGFDLDYIGAAQDR